MDKLNKSTYTDRKTGIYLRYMTVEDTDKIVAWRNSDAVRSRFIYRERFTTEGSKYGIMILTLIMAFAATYIIEYLGYVITYCLLCTGMLACFKEKRWYFYLITYVLVVLIYFGFTKFLYVPLPSIL